jgi:cytochrome c biogenesis factor
MATTAVALLALVLVLVVVGSAAPVVRRLAGDAGTAVGGWFYARLVGSLAVVGLGILLVAAPVRSTLRAIAIVLGCIAGIASLAGGWSIAGAAVAAMAVAVVVVSAVAAADRRGPMWVAHLGIAVLLAGIAGTTATEARTVSLATGASERVGPVVVTNQDVSVEGGASVVTELRLTDGRTDRDVRAGLVAYPERQGLLAETALWSRPWRDVQVTLVRADDTGRAVLEVRVRPLAQLLWWGAVLTVAGVVLSARVSGRRRASSGAASPESSPGRAHRHAARQRGPAPEVPGSSVEVAGATHRSSGPDPGARASTT